MISEAQKRAQRNYVKNNVKRFVVNFYTSEEDKALYEWLQAQEKMNAYIKNLIKKDMEEKEGK